MLGQSRPDVSSTSVRRDVEPTDKSTLGRRCSVDMSGMSFCIVQLLLYCVMQNIYDENVLAPTVVEVIYLLTLSSIDGKIGWISVAALTTGDMQNNM